MSEEPLRLPVPPAIDDLEYEFTMPRCLWCKLMQHDYEYGWEHW